MAESGRKVEVRFGAFSCTVEGYDDPVVQMREVLMMMQQMIRETPSLADRGPAFGEAEMARIEDALDRRAESEGGGAGIVVIRGPGYALERGRNSDADAEDAVTTAEIPPEGRRPPDPAPGEVPVPDQAEEASTGADAAGRDHGAGDPDAGALESGDIDAGETDSGDPETGGSERPLDDETGDAPAAAAIFSAPAAALAEAAFSADLADPEGPEAEAATESTDETPEKTPSEGDGSEALAEEEPSQPGVTDRPGEETTAPDARAEDANHLWDSATAEMADRLDDAAPTDATGAADEQEAGTAPEEPLDREGSPTGTERPLDSESETGPPADAADHTPDASPDLRPDGADERLLSDAETASAERTGMPPLHAGDTALSGPTGDADTSGAAPSDPFDLPSPGADAASNAPGIADRAGFMPDEAGEAAAAGTPTSETDDAAGAATADDDRESAAARAMTEEPGDAAGPTAPDVSAATPEPDEAPEDSAADTALTMSPSEAAGRLNIFAPPPPSAAEAPAPGVNLFARPPAAATSAPAVNVFAAPVAAGAGDASTSPAEGLSSDGDSPQHMFSRPAAAQEQEGPDAASAAPWVLAGDQAPRAAGDEAPDGAGAAPARHTDGVDDAEIVPDNAAPDREPAGDPAGRVNIFATPPQAHPLADGLSGEPGTTAGDGPGSGAAAWERSAEAPDDDDRQADSVGAGAGEDVLETGSDTDTGIGIDRPHGGQVDRLDATDPPGIGWQDGLREPPRPIEEPSRFAALLARLGGRRSAHDDAQPGARNERNGNGGGEASPADLAERAGASSVADLLAVAAAWLTLVEGKPRFTRREVMEAFERLPGDHPRTIEARIKAFGKLVRASTLILVDDGVFAMAQAERDRYQAMIDAD